MTVDCAFDRRTYFALTSKQLDELPYGAIVLDCSGIVVEYNRTESRAVGLSRKRVIGKHFFNEIAPCTRVHDFYDRFIAYVEAGRTSIEAFEFLFAFRTGIQHVTILFVRDARQMDRVSLIMLRHGSRV